MDVDPAVEGIDHLFFSRKRSQDAQFYLRIIGTHQYMSLIRLERFTDLTGFIIPDGDVLQIRIVTGKPSRLSDHL